MEDSGIPSKPLSDTALTPSDSLSTDSQSLPTTLEAASSTSSVDLIDDFPDAMENGISSKEPPKRVPSLRSVSDRSMHPSSTTKGLLGKARNPFGASASSSFAGRATSGTPENDPLARARAFAQERLQQGLAVPSNSPASPASPGPGGSPAFTPRMQIPLSRPAPVVHQNSAPGPLGKPSLADRRRGGGLKLSDMGASPSPSPSPGIRRAGAPKLSDMKLDQPSPAPSNPPGLGSRLDDFKKYVDTENGWVTFDGAATITRTGVNFSNGQTFSISLDEVVTLGELGKGNYGTVYKVKHAKPTAPRFGHGLSGFKASQPESTDTNGTDSAGQNGSSTSSGTMTGKVMAMKEIRLELDDAKFSTILKELVILHECVSPYIIDFYGAFYQEGAVYMCIEYMDGGSVDKLYAGGIPENVLRKITNSTILGLKSLKDDHNIIHRDVKPTNILANTQGQIKICDFGVSGNLVASIAKTNIGCQSYMAPERISGGAMTAVGSSDGTYSVQSDVWSLGLTIIECAMGQYPYPQDVSSTIFSQISAIVEGEPPSLPEDSYSDIAKDFVRSCVRKVPKSRPTYAALLRHPWLSSLSKPQTITEVAEEGDEADHAADAVAKMDLGGTQDAEVADWVKAMLGGNDNGDDVQAADKPALHTAPLNGGSGSPVDVK